MPHIIIEHSTDGHAQFDAAALMRALHDAAAGTGVVQAADLKIRTLAYSDYLVAGQRDGFCHVTLYLLEGRTPEQKVLLSEAIRTTMVQLLPQTKSLSVDIRDMDPVAYKKRLLG
ncbi:5-carboxymethyl-2-hydroxymuconate Delta-isomerase [Tardiphaga sp.]|uniref:5-carboxymethyl-2-hydroxymuconate Delta-isomerase n=1 Tax=Tardiphaga sp. TaxID=1926292 RepID=UPI0026241867|nr:5-carboxymethyl-2-hydroxymuconate Delta-isomerase [Tardiphaga sp.]MDB5619386.1 5-carboxymethyl-2-hydroxymuconate isomerase [Tardiphaga sp.]